MNGQLTVGNRPVKNRVCKGLGKVCRNGTVKVDVGQRIQIVKHVIAVSRDGARDHKAFDSRFRSADAHVIQLCDRRAVDFGGDHDVNGVAEVFGDDTVGEFEVFCRIRLRSLGCGISGEGGQDKPCHHRQTQQQNQQPTKGCFQVHGFVSFSPLFCFQNNGN